MVLPPGCNSIVDLQPHDHNLPQDLSNGYDCPAVSWMRPYCARTLSYRLFIVSPLWWCLSSAWSLCDPVWDGLGYQSWPQPQPTWRIIALYRLRSWVSNVTLLIRMFVVDHDLVLVTYSLWSFLYRLPTWFSVHSLTCFTLLTFTWPSASVATPWSLLLHL